jgi:hypothetical protein
MTTVLQSEETQLQNTLLYKWLIINSFALLLLYIAWLQGWIVLVLVSDTSYLSWAIALVFAVFWLTSSYHILLLNREFTRFSTAAPHGIAAEYFTKLRTKSRNQRGAPVDQTLLASALRLRLQMPIHIVNQVANTLILLGLIGTVVGFVIAVSGLGESIGQGDSLERVKSVMSQIINGMSVALFTTLAGSLLGGIWLQVHYQLLLRAATRLLVEVVEHAEVEVIPALTVTRPDA